eukprot:jgi/Ulvmu1/8260/UM041_0071.1
MIENPRTLSDALRLDRQFRKIVYEVEQRIGILNRQAAMRVRHWLHHLSLPTKNLTWKRIRNQHCHVLLHQLGKGRLTQPFDREPADGPLENMPAHVLAEWRASVRRRSGRKVPEPAINSSMCSTASSCAPKPCVPEPSPPAAEHLSSSKQAMRLGLVDHRRSVSAQAGLLRRSDAQISISRLNDGRVARTPSPHAKRASSRAKYESTRQDMSHVKKHTADGGHFKDSTAPLFDACDTHQKVQQCQNLLRQHTQTQQRSSWRQSIVQWRPQTQRASLDLSVPDIELDVKSVLPKTDCGWSVSRIQPRSPPGIGQITQSEPPLAFVAASCTSPYGHATARLSRLSQNLRKAQMRLACSTDSDMHMSSSSASSFKDARAASLTCSTDSSCSKIDKGWASKEEQHPLRMHPSILRAHLDKMQLAEQNMMQRCTARSRN